jgi:hypothetical protein
LSQKLLPQLLARQFNGIAGDVGHPASAHAAIPRRDVRIANDNPYLLDGNAHLFGDELP